MQEHAWKDLRLCKQAGGREARGIVSKLKGMHIRSGRGDYPQTHGLSKVTRFTYN